jgi:hypothetical protein
MFSIDKIDPIHIRQPYLNINHKSSKHGGEMVWVLVVKFITSYIILDIILPQIGSTWSTISHKSAGVSLYGNDR